MRRIAFLTAVVFLCGCGSREQAAPISQTTDDKAASQPSPSPAPSQAVSYLKASEASFIALKPAVQDDLKRAETMIAEGKLGSAIELLSRIIAGHADTALAFVLRGRARAELHQDADALADFSTAVRLEPKFAGHLVARGFFLLGHGDTQEATADFNEAIRLNPNEARAYNHRGMARVTMGDWTHALEDFNEAIKVDPRFVNAYINRSFAYSRADRRKEALADLDEAIKIDPKAANSYNNRGMLHVQNDDFPKALEDFSQAVKYDPANPVFYSHRRDVHKKLQNYALAQADQSKVDRLMQLSALNQAVFRDRKSTKPFLERGDYFVEERQYATAIANFDYALKLDPKCWRALAERARAWLGQGDAQRALDDSTAALAIEPREEIYALRGDAYRKLGNYAKAVADYEASQRFDKAVADTWLLHSQALRQGGQLKEADAALARANEFKAINAPNGN